MTNKNVILKIDAMIRQHIKMSNRKYSQLSEKTYEKLYGKWDIAMHDGLEDLLFHAITGEESFYEFSERFDSPAGTKGLQPVAWDSGFIPDKMSWSLISDDPIEDRVKTIKKMYDQCIKLEKAFNKKSKKNLTSSHK